MHYIMAAVVLTAGSSRGCSTRREENTLLRTDKIFKLNIEGHLNVTDPLYQNEVKSRINWEQAVIAFPVNVRNFVLLQTDRENQTITKMNFGAFICPDEFHNKDAKRQSR